MSNSPDDVSEEGSSMGGPTLTVGRRVTLLEKWQRAQAGTLAELMKAQVQSASTLGEITKWRQEQMVNGARNEGDEKVLELRLSSIEKSLDDLKATLARIVWLMITPLVVAIVLGGAGIMVFGAQFVKP